MIAFVVHSCRQSIHKSEDHSYKRRTIMRTRIFVGVTRSHKIWKAWSQKTFVQELSGRVECTICKPEGTTVEFTTAMIHGSTTKTVSASTRIEKRWLCKPMPRFASAVNDSMATEANVVVMISSMRNSRGC